MVTTCALPELGKRAATHLSLSLLPTSPFSLRHGQHEDKRHPRFFCPFLNFTTEQLLQSHSFLPLILSSPWPVDQAMASQILLATLPVLTPNNREPTLQNKAYTVDFPLQTQVRFLLQLTTSPPAMTHIVRTTYLVVNRYSPQSFFFFCSSRSRFRTRPPLQSPVFRLCRLSYEWLQCQPAWSLCRHTRILCTISRLVFRTPGTHLNRGNRRHIPGPHLQVWFPERFHAQHGQSLHPTITSFLPTLSLLFSVRFLDAPARLSCLPHVS